MTNEPNWMVTILIGLVFSIPVGIFINIITPAANNVIKKFAISTNKKKAVLLKNEFETVKSFRDYPTLLFTAVASKILYGFMAIFTSVIGGVIIFFLELIKSYYEITNLRTIFSISPQVFYSVVWALETLVGISVLYAVQLIGNSILKLTGHSIRLANFKEYEKNYKSRIKELGKKSKE